MNKIKNNNSDLVSPQRIKELEKILVDNSRFLKLLPYQVFIGEHSRGGVRALFVFPSFLVKRSVDIKKPIKKFVWLEEKQERFLIDPSSSSGYYLEEENFREIVKENGQVRKEIENILMKKFAQNLDNYHIIEEICKEENYNPNCVKKFSKLKKEDPQIFFNNLYKYIDFLAYGRNKNLVKNAENNKAKESIFCGSEKDILIIAEPETYRFIKKNDTNNFFQNLVGDIICANLENGIKLIIIAKWGILVPYIISCTKHGDLKNDYHYLNIYYEVELVEFTPALIFKE